MAGESRWSRLWNWVEDFYNKMFAVYFLLIGLTAAGFFANNRVGVWPLGHGTAVWLLSVLFPLSATLYLFANLRTRLVEIDSIGRAELYPAIYFPDAADMMD